MVDAPAGGASSAARHAPATARNGGAILALLTEILPPAGTVLEVASGTGEHAVRFAAALPHLIWQPSDPDPAARASIAAWTAASTLGNVRAPLALDAAAAWPAMHVAAIVCINMTHISPWIATQGLIRNAAACLPAGAPLLLYGPFHRAGVATAPSNLAFDESLRARDPAWGLRHVDDVAALAADAGLALDRIEPMPANNIALLFHRLPANTADQYDNVQPVGR